VSTYKRKRPQKASRDQRAPKAARLRAEGKSLREIAAETGVSHQTVRNDLTWWDECQEAAPPNVIALSSRASKTGVKNDPRTGQDLTPGFDARRTTGDVIGLTVREERIARLVTFLIGEGA
jgi:Homeodomain-like domain